MVNLKQINCAKPTVSPRSIECNSGSQYSKLMHQSHHALGYRFFCRIYEMVFQKTNQRCLEFLKQKPIYFWLLMLQLPSGTVRFKSTNTCTNSSISHCRTNPPGNSILKGSVVWFHMTRKSFVSVPLSSVPLS